MNKPTRQAALRVFAGWGDKPWLSVAVLAAVVALRIIDPSTIERLRLAYFDFQQAAWLLSPQDRRVAIVDIDQASLTAIGQWPWPRSTVARITTAIATMQPAVIGFDVLLPLPDRLSPGAAPLAPRHQ
jgi:adenylate cyclase